MFRGIIGGTGGGKTMTLVGKMIGTLLDTERFCVTTLQELEMPRLNEYLQEQVEMRRKKFPARNQPAVDLDKRLLVIPKQDTRWFYRHRRNGLVLPPYDELDRNGKKKPLELFNAEIEPYFEQVYAHAGNRPVGIDYFLTECHRFFPSREFQSFARTMGFFSTQHRHFDDNVWLETQFPGQLDLNFRELILEWYHIDNHYRKSFGAFQRQGQFAWSMYYQLPTGKMVPDDKGTFKLDTKGVATCYRTRGAVSALSGSEAEAQPKSKKLPFWLFPVAIVGAIVLAGFGVAALPKIAEKGVSAMMGGFIKGGDSITAGVSPVQPGRPVPATSAAPQSVSSPAPSAAPQPDPVYVVGVVHTLRKITVTLSDGRVFVESDPEMKAPGTRFDRAGVTIGGVRYPMARPEARPASLAAPQPQSRDQPPVAVARPAVAPESAAVRETAFKPIYGFGSR